MDKRAVVVLVAIFGSLFLALFGFLFLAWSATSGERGGPSFGAGDIGVVEVKGPILDGEDAVEQLHEFLLHDGIRAVVVRVDSPGGAVAPSQEIAAEVKRLAEKKTVVVSMGNVAASGGYYLSAPATKIVANPGTVTGSIGVITQLPNVSQITDKIGFEMNVVKSGPAKDVGNPFRPFTEDDRQVFQRLIDDVYGQFVRAVAEGRNLPEEKVRSIADGRILTGAEAKEAGLVDELGNFHDAVQLAADLVGIEGEPQLVYPPEKHGFSLESLFTGGARALAKAAADEVQLRIEGRAGGGASVQYLLPGY